MRSHTGSSIQLSRRYMVGERAFTLLEMLVAFTVFTIILSVVTGVMSSTSSLWLKHRNQSTTFEAANAAFDALTRTMAQAVLNTYWEVKGNTYSRLSELHFVTGPTVQLLATGSASVYPGDAVFFQAALGRSSDSSLKRLPNLLNNIGYFVRFDAGPNIPFFLAPVVKDRYRYRLYEWLEPTQNLGTYNPPDDTTDGQRAWFRKDLANKMLNTAVLAENVIGLIFMAEYPNASGASTPAYSYDSKNTNSPATLHQLPPRISVLMVVIDETSAKRLADYYGIKEPSLGPDSSWFQNPAEFDMDIRKWEAKLSAVVPRIEYRIFTTTISIQNAKWSL